MQIIIYIVKILKHIQVSFPISKVIDAESPLINFFLNNLCVFLAANWMYTL